MVSRVQRSCNAQALLDMIKAKFRFQLQQDCYTGVPNSHLLMVEIHRDFSSGCI